MCKACPIFKCIKDFYNNKMHYFLDKKHSTLFEALKVHQITENTWGRRREREKFILVSANKYEESAIHILIPYANISIILSTYSQTLLVEKIILTHPRHFSLVDSA